MFLIEAHNLKKIYEQDGVETIAVSETTFNIEPGEFVAIMGPSGSGKSTLMNIVGFLDKPTAGEYLFKEKNIKDLTDDEMAAVRNKEIGFVFQSFNLLPRTTVFDNVRLPLIYSATPNREQRNKIKKAIEAVGLTHREKYLSSQLSGGEKQRVAIARALVNDPDLILADEPTGNLDSRSGNQIMKILQDLNNLGKTIIMVTHEKDTAEHARRIIQVKDGAIVSDNRVANQHLALDNSELLK